MVITIKKIIVIMLLLATALSFCCVSPTNAASTWYQAFYNDVDGDGVKDFASFTYTGITSYACRYFYTLQDFPDYPKYSVAKYDGVTDAEWEEADNRYYAAEGQLENARQQYGEASEQYTSALAALAAAEEYFQELEDKDTASYDRYYTDVNAYEAALGFRVNNTINGSKTVVATEEQKLSYWLHIPFDYNENKSYPILVFYPGSGSVVRGYGSGNYAIADLTPDMFYYGKYCQTVSTKSNMVYGSRQDVNGEWLPGKKDISDGSWCSAFFANWYEQVKDPGEGRDKYDCFIIYCDPTDAAWFSTSNYLSTTGMTKNDATAGRVVTLSADVTGDSSYRASHSTTYIASELDACPDAQLVVALIDDMMKEYNIDPARQYIAGGSLGGLFTMDTIAHYPDRFACAIPVVAAGADISEENAKNLTNMNIWAVSGAGDTNCSKYYSKFFVNAVNDAREKFGTGAEYTAQYSFFPGGHACSYIGATLRNATEGVSITYNKQVLDFMFGSSRDDIYNGQYASNINEVLNAKVYAITSYSTYDGKYNMVLISTAPLGEYAEYGFAITSYDKNLAVGHTTKKVKVPERTTASNVTLNGKSFTINALDYGAAYIYTQTITGIPTNVTDFSISPYAVNACREYFGTAVNFHVTVSGVNVCISEVAE